MSISEPLQRLSGGFDTEVFAFRLENASPRSCRAGMVRLGESVMGWLRCAAMTHRITEPLFRKIDGLRIPVSDLEAGLAFYRDRLGHHLIWRTPTSAGLRMPDTDAELVIHTERKDIETDLLVSSADEAAVRIVEAGGSVVVQPFDIPIGRCAVVQDPWGNRLVLLDQSKGLLVTDADGVVQTDAHGIPLVKPPAGR
jgi:predicted enzyme related to lactoylglutathione lyase